MCSQHNTQDKLLPKKKQSFSEILKKWWIKKTNAEAIKSMFQFAFVACELHEFKRFYDVLSFWWICFYFFMISHVDKSNRFRHSFAGRKKKHAPNSFFLNTKNMFLFHKLSLMCQWTAFPWHIIRFMHGKCENFVFMKRNVISVVGTFATINI